MNKGRFYIAARYSKRDEMKAFARILQGHGFEVTSRLLAEDKPLDTKLGDDTEDFYRETAATDIADIDRADTLVFFAEDPHVGTPRGGRHVEFGYAMAKFKRLIVIGGEENIFHFLPSVITFPTVQSFIESEIEQ